jgi:hypothetical protein
MLKLQLLRMAAAASSQQTPTHTAAHALQPHLTTQMLCRSDKLRLLTPRSGIGVAGPSARRAPGLPTLPHALPGRGGSAPPPLTLRGGPAPLLGDSRPAAGGAPPPLTDWRRAVAERAAFAARACAASSTSACRTSSTSNCTHDSRQQELELAWVLHPGYKALPAILHKHHVFKSAAGSYSRIHIRSSTAQSYLPLPHRPAGALHSPCRRMCREHMHSIQRATLELGQYS